MTPLSSTARDTEQREWTRYTLDLPARVALSDLLFSEAKILDFSAAGMRVAVLAPTAPLNLQRGMLVHTGFALDGQPIQARMSLVRARSVGAHIELGVSFALLNPEVYRLLVDAASAITPPRSLQRESVLEQVLWRLRERLRLCTDWSAKNGGVEPSYFLLLARVHAGWESFLHRARSTQNPSIPTPEALVAQLQQMFGGADGEVGVLITDIVDEVLNHKVLGDIAAA